MSEKRASKKQRELLEFIERFIKENEYGPSYREIMRALDYKSVSTVAVHVDGLISRGLLRKKDNSARSLELVSGSNSSVEANQSDYADWLRKEVDRRERQLKTKDDEMLGHEIAVLTEAIEILRLGAKPKADV